MNSENILNTHIVPGGICDFPSGGGVFLFLEYPGKAVDLLNRITHHIQNLDIEILSDIEKKLDLQLRSASWDVHGNVCFADDPNLRPEYRTNFHALDLWDYYYAVWHSQVYWDSGPAKAGYLPLPHPDYFWNLIRLGTRLREIHSSKTKHSNYQITLSDPKNSFVLTLRDRFRITEEGDTHGRLYVNDRSYLEHISRIAWEYQLAGIKPLPRWLNEHRHQSLSSHDLEALATIIEAVEETHSIQSRLDHTLIV